MDRPFVLLREHFDELFEALQRRGYRCVGPTARDGAIVYDRIDSAADLPEGLEDEQAPGYYRLRERGDRALFGHVVGPHSWKQFLFPSEQRLWRLRRTGPGFEQVAGRDEPERLAFVGVRACEIEALRVQDRVFATGRFVDGYYRAARQAALVVAVSCTRSAATCFCASVATGPAVASGYDLRLIEMVGAAGIADSGEDERDEAVPHRFLVDAATPAGREILAELPARPASPAEVAGANARVDAAAVQQRAMDQSDLPAQLRASLESPQWEQIAERCLSCANCTLVCPTCFCSDVEDVSDLTGEHAERWRRWDSCFDPGFSYLGGGEIRKTTASRYRQWMTHKLGTWVEQFGTSGCVGCGRCISWCPVGIDLTEEVVKMQQQTGAER